MVRIVEPSAELVWCTPDAEQMIARIARTCYRSEERGDRESNIALLKRLIARGHFAMLDHASASIRFVTDRGISHEMVRHRLAGYAQESTRYCNYSREKFGKKITVVKPGGLDLCAQQAWEAQMAVAERAYFDLLAMGEKPQIARAVLPTCTKTEIVMTCDFTEWLHFLRLRMSPAAHPDMQRLAGLAFRILQSIAPVVFDRRNFERDLARHSKG